MVLGLKPMGKPTTYKYQVLSRTKVLHGPRTQTYGETNYLNIKFWGNQILKRGSDTKLAPVTYGTSRVRFISPQKEVQM